MTGVNHAKKSPVKRRGRQPAGSDAGSRAPSQGFGTGSPIDAGPQSSPFRLVGRRAVCSDQGPLDSPRPNVSSQPLANRQDHRSASVVKGHRAGGGVLGPLPAGPRRRAAFPKEQPPILAHRMAAAVRQSRPVLVSSPLLAAWPYPGRRTCCRPCRGSPTSSRPVERERLSSETGGTFSGGPTDGVRTGTDPACCAEPGDSLV